MIIVHVKAEKKQSVCVTVTPSNNVLVPGGDVIDKNMVPLF